MANSQETMNQSVKGFRGIDINGYKPFGFLNLALGVISGLGLGFGALEFYNGESEMGLIAILVGIVFLALIMVRNRKVNNVPKMIGFSIVTSVLGILLVVVGILKALSAGMKMADKMS